MPEASRFDTLYLHVGLDKTGTTSVQQDLVLHRDLLESSYGILFPCRFSSQQKFRGNHSDLLRPLFAEDPMAARRLAARGLHSPNEVAAFNRSTEADLEACFENSQARQLLLSAEVISHFKPVDLEGLAKWCKGFAAEVVVIACIRHPLHALSSEIQQRLRIGARLQNLYQNPPYYRFRELVGQLESVFGAPSLRLYSFHRAVEHPGGLTAALLSACGIQTGGEFQPSSPANTSMSAEAALLLDAYNCERPAFIAGKRNRDRNQRVVMKLAGIPGQKYLAPAPVHRVLEAAAAEDLEWLLGRFDLDLSHPEIPTGDMRPGFSEESLRDISLKLATQFEA